MLRSLCSRKHRQLTKGLTVKNATYTYSDDLSNVEALTIKQTDADDAGKTSDVPAGASLAASQRVSIQMTQGDTVYLIDTAQANTVAALIRSAGVKQKKRGAKAQAS